MFDHCTSGIAPSPCIEISLHHHSHLLRFCYAVQGNIIPPSNWDQTNTIPCLCMTFSFHNATTRNISGKTQNTFKFACLVWDQACSWMQIVSDPRTKFSKYFSHVFFHSEMLAIDAGTVIPSYPTFHNFQ